MPSWSAGWSSRPVPRPNSSRTRMASVGFRNAARATATVCSGTSANTRGRIDTATHLTRDAAPTRPPRDNPHRSNVTVRCWRTLDGLADFAIIWSYLSTAAKRSLDHLDVLVELFTTGPWLPPDPTPI